MEQADKTDENEEGKKKKGEGGASKKATREPAAPHTHTPDLRFTLNTQRKRQVFLFTSR